MSVCVCVNMTFTQLFFVLLTVQTRGTDSLRRPTWFDDALARLALHAAFSVLCILARQTILLIGQSSNLPITREIIQSNIYIS